MDYCDPYIPQLPEMRKHGLNLKSVELTDDCIKNYDCVIIATDHDVFDYVPPAFINKS